MSSVCEQLHRSGLLVAASTPVCSKFLNEEEQRCYYTSLGRMMYTEPFPRFDMLFSKSKAA